MEFGIENCATTIFKRGKLAKVDNIVVNEHIVLKTIEANEIYKYLGIHECDGIQHKTMKKHIKKEYYNRIRKI